MLSALLSFLGTHLLFLILHVQNGSSFPKPLPPKEEAAYLKKMKEGDRNARGVLIERNLRLVSHIVKKYYSRMDEPEELISIGTIGLIKAVDSFDTDKGIRFATYAARCIENEILMYFRAMKKREGDIFLGDTVEVDKDGNPLTVEDTLSDDACIEDNLEKKIRWSKVKAYLEQMDDARAREIIILRYGLNRRKPLTQREVAQRLNISRSYVSRIETKTLNEIRRHLK